MNERGQGRIEQSGAGETDANHIDRDGTGEVLPDNPARPARDRQRFGELEQVVAQQNHIRALARNVSSRTHRDADACFA